MSTECKHCGYGVSILWILWKRFRTGELPACPECGANEGTLESVSEDGEDRVMLLDERSDQQ